MPFKTKLFSLVIVCLLILPVLINPQRSGKVLGTNERGGQIGGSVSPSVEQAADKNTPTSNTNLTVSEVKNINTEIPKQSRIGEIGSGIRDVRTVETPKNQGQIITGKAIWDENAKSSVSTDKFSLGSGIKVTFNDKTLSLVVGNSRILSSDTILVLDKKTFQELGGDLERGEIQVSVVQDQ
jgi:hypothetical protein